MAAVGGRSPSAGHGGPAEAVADPYPPGAGGDVVGVLPGIAVCLAANIAAAPALEWKPVLVAGWPLVALLLSVELLAHRSSPTVEAEGSGLSQERDAPAGAGTDT